MTSELFITHKLTVPTINITPLTKETILRHWNQIIFNLYHKYRSGFAMLVAFIFVLSCNNITWAQTESQVEAAQLRQPPTAQVIHEHCLNWLKENANEKQLKSWQQLVLPQEPTQPQLELIIKAISLVDEPTRVLSIELPTMPKHEIATAIEKYQPQINDSWISSNLKLWLGRELSQRHLYEEALQEFVQVDTQELVDPATYFFYRAVCEHHLLLKTEALASLNSLLTQCKPLPSRYRMVGELMKQDIAKLEEKSLDEISRKMTDVKRRLNLGRAGEKVQKLEKEIIESLDELIKKLEQQAANASSSSSSGTGKGNQPNSGAKDSRVKGSTAPGNVDDKDIGRKDGWGKLPPKDQAKAKQILGTLFPPHYRRAIEAYNRKAAQREAPTP
ncbi:MAG: hypothetical protein JKY95_12255 [Planctomycetaceae bacterium]|nr:hypothetical protein [Planctomycetaceae bacterium]